MSISPHGFQSPARTKSAGVFSALQRRKDAKAGPGDAPAAAVGPTGKALKL